MHNENDYYIEDRESSGDRELPEAEDRIQKLSQELKRCRTEREEYMQGWQRAQADVVNERRQQEKEKEEFLKFAEYNILSKLLEIINTFDHAFHGSDPENPYVKGFGHIYSQLLALLHRHGVKEISSIGNPLDPSLHEAVGTVPVKNLNEDNIIQEELEKGYLLHGKVVKPSKVKVGEYSNTN